MRHSWGGCIRSGPPTQERHNIFWTASIQFLLEDTGIWITQSLQLWEDASLREGSSVTSDAKVCMSLLLCSDTHDWKAHWKTPLLFKPKAKRTMNHSHQTWTFGFQRKRNTYCSITSMPQLKTQSKRLVLGWKTHLYQGFLIWFQKGQTSWKDQSQAGGVNTMPIPLLKSHIPSSEDRQEYSVLIKSARR